MRAAVLASCSKAGPGPLRIRVPSTPRKAIDLSRDHYRSTLARYLQNKGAQCEPDSPEATEGKPAAAKPSPRSFSRNSNCRSPQNPKGVCSVASSLSSRVTDDIPPPSRTVSPQDPPSTRSANNSHSGTSRARSPSQPIVRHPKTENKLLFLAELELSQRLLLFE
ncbi:hypothetical protein VTH06DRAFT_4115 [Thermothelomyces fergusii]